MHVEASKLLVFTSWTGGPAEVGPAEVGPVIGLTQWASSCWAGLVPSGCTMG